MKKQIAVIAVLLFSGFFLCMSKVIAAQDPIATVKSVADQMIGHLQQNRATLKTNPSLVYSLANRIIVPRADLDEMSRRVLPPVIWNQASPGQRSEFKREFTTVLVRTYASALASYTDQTIQFYPIRGGSQGRSTVTVNSEIVRSDGPSIPVKYSLILRGSDWKLYDMTVEGVSMLQSFRSQFADKLSQGNMASLIHALRQHNASNSRGSE